MDNSFQSDPPDDPAAPADDQGSNIAPDHPATDSNIDPHEAYDEGIAGAAEVNEPSDDQGDAEV